MDVRDKIEATSSSASSTSDSDSSEEVKRKEKTKRKVMDDENGTMELPTNSPSASTSSDSSFNDEVKDHLFLGIKRLKIMDDTKEEISSASSSPKEILIAGKNKRQIMDDPEDKIGATSQSSSTSSSSDSDFEGFMRPIKRMKISDDATDNIGATSPSPSTSASCDSGFMNEVQNILSAGLAKMQITDDPKSAIGAIPSNPTNSDSTLKVNEVKEIKEVVHQKNESFLRRWAFNDFLIMIQYADIFERPFTADSVGIQFQSEIFNGIWNFSLSKLPRCALRVRAIYSKMDKPIGTENFIVTLDVVHKLIRLRCGPRESGIVKIEKFSKLEQVMSGEENDGGNQRNVETTVYSYEMEWIIGDPIVRELIILAKHNNTCAFSFNIVGRPNQPED